ncbi:MAG: PEP/pyruvate-binding domain-containing protein [Vicinamibacterales bacterium]
MTDSSLLPRLLPGPYAELTAARTALERALRDMQDFEFTIEEGQLYFLQTRDAKRTPWAALQIAVDLANAGIIERDTAIARLAPYELGSIVGASPDLGLTTRVSRLV